MKLRSGLMLGGWGTRWWFHLGKIRFYFTMGCGLFWITVER